MTPRKHPSAAFYATVVVVVALALPAYSFSEPLAWRIFVRGQEPRWACHALWIFYYPLSLAYRCAPKEIQRWKDKCDFWIIEHTR